MDNVLVRRFNFYYKDRNDEGNFELPDFWIPFNIEHNKSGQIVIWAYHLPFKVFE